MIFKEVVPYPHVVIFKGVVPYPHVVILKGVVPYPHVVILKEVVPYPQAFFYCIWVIVVHEAEESISNREVDQSGVC